MLISNHGKNLIREFEGLKLNAYQDSGGIWTIGYGYTGMINGKKIDTDTVFTKEMAEFYLNTEVEKISKLITNLLKVKLNQYQFDAIGSLVYNIGLGNFSKSRLLRYINNSEFSFAADEFIRWNKCKGRILHGLTFRRMKEKELFIRKE
ncbi:TPA: lysozyme [Salmonella bongori]|uniref:Lysozyme n=1 Tax=Salmonella bongori N268-08 TaxID=1197719 RepID=S5MZ25_SALBN|nr:lysozyme [Salmonella bongori]AGR61946.1 Lysozyme [Salmonella bongori N268-08]ECE6549023.1 lysozyme [Salmonella bongori]ECI3520736.1 muraminidase [Salmonella bongori]EDP8577925.1 lysozyme [Salmonella bongori]EDP8595630.1 lysozyme [Salmonella bongori]